MSRRVEQAVTDVANSKFIWHGANTLEVENAVILWTRFSGRPDKFGSTVRRFSLVLNEDIAAQLAEKGFSVHDTELREVVNKDGTPATLKTISVRANMEGAFPPTVTLFSTFRGKRNRRTLNKDTIGELDTIDLSTCDMVINCYEAKRFPGKRTGYLKQLNAIQAPVIDFGGKYDAWEEDADADIDDDDTPYSGPAQTSVDHGEPSAQELADEVPELIPDPVVKTKKSK